ncbi:MAG: ComEC/Rec2 family competence protein [Verrucomicrobia bacterium]|nr:ComEC/Rec2 family competence protein [Verrucomicrobiota bacterium]
MALLGRERQPFVSLTIAAAIGIVLADWFPALNWWLLVLTLCGAIAALHFQTAPLVLAVVGAAFFCLHSSRVLGTPADALVKFAGNEIRPASIEGIVEEEPKVQANGGATFRLRLKQARIGDETLATDATVYVHWRGTPQPGDELALFGTIEPIAPPRNPGEFDMRRYLFRRGVTRAVIVRYPENGHIVRHGSAFSLLRAAARSRDWMQRTLSRGIEDSPAATGLICGTSLGLRHQTPEDIEEPFQQTGTLHLFAVAGLHVGIVAWLLWTVASVVRIPRKVATAIIIPLLFFYAAITGLHTASVRAALMAALLMAGIFFDRKVFALNSLAAAAFIILLWDSHQLFTSGFQLSFSVVGFILIFAAPFYRLCRRVAQPDPFLPPALFSPLLKVRIKILDALARGASVSLAAWLGSLLCIYWYFHLVTPVSLFANLAVVPIAYFILALSLLSLIAAPLSSALSIIFNNANWLLSRVVLALVHLFATIPYGHIYLPEPGASRAAVSMTILDEGTGGGAHIRAHGYDWLIDCGSARTYERTLKAYLHSRGLKRLEGLILTHGDSQHIGAAGSVIGDFSPREIYDNPLGVRSTLQREIAQRFAPQILTRGDALLLGRDIEASILYPPSNLRVSAADDAPLIIQVNVGDKTNVLFESDAGADAEAALVASGADLQSDILVKGQHHHGSSGTPAFLDAVRPKLIIATSRESPVAEQITDEWKRTVAQRGIKLFAQDETGAVEITFSADGQWKARSYLTGETFRSSSR